ncbi:penicillin-binding transpeptidase domain-containing protein [Streptomyces sp. NPDC001380]|uniref:penicillin-binding transpeptidase domain-containing protein n=1 Tax=Streptomyces sp. NPDC001380 TaxID=3364566 RepID=UPI00368C7E4C
MGRAAKVTVGAVCAGMLSVAGYGVANIAGALTGGHRGSAPAARATATGDGRQTASGEAPSAGQARQAAQSFLAAWAKGDTADAAGLTDDPAAAADGLAGYHDDLHLDSLTLALTAGTPAATPLPGSVAVGFHAGARLSGLGTWAYDGTVRVVRTTDGGAKVHWSPSVLHPRLTGQTALRARDLPPAPPRITDRDGRPVDAYPSLMALAGDLQEALRARPDDGTPGKGVVIAGAESGDTLAVLHTFRKSRPGRGLRLTVDGRLQAAAERAVAEQGRGGSRLASLVAVEASTGRILAVANSQPFNAAFQGATAPGSTMKIVTAAALLEHGVSPGAAAPCRAHLYVDGKEFHNVEGSAIPGATLRDDFAASCNTGFIALRDRLGDGDLAAEARDVFGLGMTWHTGVPNRDGQVPPTGGDEVEKAADMIGQGRVQMNPLAMASVAATVRSGVFHEPVLLPDLPQQPAARPLPARVAAQLRGMMRATAVRGTAAGVMAGLGGTVGAKTGTAEVGRATDSWFTAYRDGVAAAAMVQGGGHGSAAAGPAVRAVLAASR